MSVLIKSRNCFVVPAFVVTKLGLKSGIERDVFSIIYGLSQDEFMCNVSISYIMDWTLGTEKQVYAALKKLEKKGLIVKGEIPDGSDKLSYTTNANKYCNE